MLRDSGHLKRLSYFDIVSSTPDELLEIFESDIGGISEDEAQRRLLDFGYNEPDRKEKTAIALQIAGKFLNPLVIVLLVIGAFSVFLSEGVSAVMIFLMIVLSVALSFVQEYRSGKEAEKLGEMIQDTCMVYREGKQREIKIRELVPGDIAELFVGDIIPADIRILKCKDLFINQAALTGESFPVQKFAADEVRKGAVVEMGAIAFMGSSVVSGTGIGLVVKTGANTRFGEIAQRLSAASVETGFDRGIKGFTWLMIRFMLVLVCLIFAINMISKGNPLQALLFSLAVAVGLTPEMLPTLVTINLSKGSMALARKQVIVKHLSSIQNLGAMDILCTDKTGTLTMDKVVLEMHLDVEGRESRGVLEYAYINSFYQTGLKNLLDKAILQHEHFSVSKFRKVDEVPFDFSRDIMSVVVERGGRQLIVSKGAPESIFRKCTHYELGGRIRPIEKGRLSKLKDEADRLRGQGFRVLAVAYRNVSRKKQVYGKEDEKDMVIKGYLAFLDPPKPTVKKTLDDLKRLGIGIKILTGDNEIVAEKICVDVGLQVTGMVTGEQLNSMSNKELQAIAESVTIFARVSPLQKERIILALGRGGHIVGYLGDGINDSLALKAADIGITVNNAVDIAKESSDIILLRKSLTVLTDGVIEGRKTFVNLFKYIKMGASSNFGNMLSMVGASLMLPFLPMLPIQILLNNFLYDVSQVAIPTDRVDDEQVRRPTPWNVEHIKRFMLTFGPISSVFDFLTFGILLMVFRVSEAQFHTGWFLVSLSTQVLIIYLIRTPKLSFVDSMPGRFLVFASAAILTSGFLIALTPLGYPLGFTGLPGWYFAAMAGILAAYFACVHLTKKWLIGRLGYF
ncbi:magnesium-translocating P-type ATPase [Candidatus Woesearchaeota archaeon]|nr:magnesium-translocating P-type ATPase [Candidatus Woesearchaeota archaeon]